MRRVPETAAKADWPRKVSQAVSDLIAKIKAVETSLTAQGLPTGGTANQVLTKTDGTDYNAGWQDAAGGGSSVFSAMRLTNTDTTTDINTATLTEIPLGSSTSFGSDFTQATNAIQTDFDGTVELTASVWGDSASAQRPAVACEFFKNGTSLGVRYSTGYIRSNSGHNEASTACTPWIETCEDGDLFTVRGIREGNSGTVTMATAGYTYFQAKRLA